jgi:hypothetical protein
MSPHQELVYRLALAGLSPRCRNLPRTNELIMQFDTDELGQINAEGPRGCQRIAESRPIERAL